jgi:hypothetical protein
VFGRVSHAGHSQHGGDQHPLRRRALVTVVVAALLAALALLLAPPHARGNFVYWANPTTPGSIGRAKINGTGFNKKPSKQVKKQLRRAKSSDFAAD